MSYERTKPAYPTFGPEDGTGRDWHQYFRDLKGRDVVADPDGDSDDLLEPITPLVAAHEVEEGWPTPINSWRVRLLANDWRVKVGHASAFHGDAYYVNGNLKKAAHKRDVWWINAVRDGMYVTISWLYTDGKVISGSLARKVSSRWGLLSDAEMKELIES